MVVSVSGNDIIRRDVTTVFTDQDLEFDIHRTTNLDKITAGRNPILDEEVSKKRYTDNELDKNTILKFSQTLQNCLKLLVGNKFFRLTKKRENKY